MTQPRLANLEFASAPHTVDFGQPLPPSDDPFGIPPQGYAATSPGTVLRSRQIRVAFLGVIDQPVTGYQLLYRTTDLHGAPQAALTTVLLPDDAPKEAQRPVLSYQCAIDAVKSEAFPSYVLRRQAKIWGGFAPLEYPLIACALDNGWAVLVPDHEGPRGSWIAPREPGHYVLDSIRAAQNFEPADIDASAPVALWGYSGGGLATGWTAELAGDYAPELNIVGAVLGSPVGNPGEVLRDLNGTLFAGLAAMGLAALTHQYPSLRRIIATNVDLAGQSLLAAMSGLTTVGALARFCRGRFDKFFDQPLDGILELPAVTELFDEIRLGKSVPGMPLLVLQATGDQVIDVRHIDTLVETYRAAGAQVTYLRDLLSEHFSLHPAAAPLALSWISNRFAGKPVGPSTTRRGSLLLSPRTLVGFGRLGRVVLQVARGGGR